MASATATPSAIVSISSLYAMCITSFNILHTLLDTNCEFADQISRLDLQDELGRFRVWAGNVGAHRVGRVSLDHRLRESSGIHATVAGLIKDLDYSLREVIAIVSHERPPADEMSSDSDSSASSLDDESRSEPDGGLNSTTEVETRFLDTKHIIGCLYRLSIVIRNPASRDRLQKCADIDVAHYEPFDIAHASHKFPTAEQYLIDRLGKANTKRRQLLQYHQKHHTKLAMYIDLPADVRLDHHNQADDEEAASEMHQDPGWLIEHPIPSQSVTATTVITQTTATTFVQPSSMPHEGSDTGQSQTSYATSVGDTSTKLCIPNPPPLGRALDGDPFECPYCFCIITADGSRSWMQHVFRDLRPYVCTFQGCPKPDRLFQSRHEWYDHEVENHRREWFCNACEQLFTTSELLISHVIHSHPEVSAGMQLDALADRCERVIDRLQPCPLCGGEYLPLQLQTHLGRHMQQLALFVLSKMCVEGENDEEEDSDYRGERTKSSILGSFHTNPDRADLEEPLSSTPSGIDDTLRPRDELIDATGETTRAEDIRHDGSQLEPGCETKESSQTPTHPVTNMTAAEEDCLSIFEEFIDSEQPGWRAFYKDRGALAAHATRGVGMIEQLVKDGCDMEKARRLVLLTLCDVMLFIEDSLSMGTAQKETLTKTLNAITSVTDIVKPDRVWARFVTSDRGKKNVNGNCVKEIVSRCSMEGSMNLESALERKFWSDEYVRGRMTRPWLVIVMLCGSEAFGWLAEAIGNRPEPLFAQDEPHIRTIAYQFCSLSASAPRTPRSVSVYYRAKLREHVNCFSEKYPLADISDPDKKWNMVTKLLLGAFVRKVGHDLRPQFVSHYVAASTRSSSNAWSMFGAH